MSKSGRSTGRLKKLYSLDGTAEILEYLDAHPGCRKRDLEGVASPPIISKRLHTFLALRLITKGLELTDGRRALELLKRLEVLAERINDLISICR